MDKYDNKLETENWKPKQNEPPQNEPPFPVSSLPFSVVLVGLMGSGKSSVARALAFRWHCEAIDTDTLIENATGLPIAEIFSRLGESEFRRFEREQLQVALEYSGVIATGGGIVTQPENCQRLQAAVQRGVFVVYLRATSAELARRIRRQPGKRPLIDGNGPLNLAQTQRRVESLLQQRGPLYESVATLIIDTGTPDSSVVAEEIESALIAAKI